MGLVCDHSQPMDGVTTHRSSTNTGANSTDVTASAHLIVATHTHSALLLSFCVQILMDLSREPVANIRSSWLQEQSQMIRACALFFTTIWYGASMHNSWVNHWILLSEHDGLYYLPGSSSFRSDRHHMRSLDAVRSQRSLCENRARVTVNVCPATLPGNSFQFPVSNIRTTACSGVAAWFFKNQVSIHGQNVILLLLLCSSLTLHADATYLPSWLASTEIISYPWPYLVVRNNRVSNWQMVEWND